MKINHLSILVAVALAALFLSTSHLPAQTTPSIQAIEQDWRVELYSVSDPDRVTCPLFISSFAIPKVPALLQVTWNHREEPDVEEGGIQLQLYRWENLVEDREVLTPPWREKLSDANETVRWTQRLQIADLAYVFTVKDIVGTTWGSIPGPYVVKRPFLVWAPPLELYTFEEIKSNSGIVVGTNRFKKLAVVETRFYLDDGTIKRDTTERIIFAQPPTYEYFESRRLNE